MQADRILEIKTKNKTNNRHVYLPHLSGWRIMTCYDTAVSVKYVYLSVLVGSGFESDLCLGCCSHHAVPRNTH